MPLCLPQDAPVFVAFRLPVKNHQGRKSNVYFCQDESHHLRRFSFPCALRFFFPVCPVGMTREGWAVVLWALLVLCCSDPAGATSLKDQAQACLPTSVADGTYLEFKLVRAHQ